MTMPSCAGRGRRRSRLAFDLEARRPPARWSASSSVIARPRRARRPGGSPWRRRWCTVRALVGLASPAGRAAGEHRPGVLRSDSCSVTVDREAGAAQQRARASSRSCPSRRARSPAPGPWRRQRDRACPARPACPPAAIVRDDPALVHRVARLVLAPSTLKPAFSQLPCAPSLASGPRRRAPRRSRARPRPSARRSSPCRLRARLRVLADDRARWAGRCASRSTSTSKPALRSAARPRELSLPTTFGTGPCRRRVSRKAASGAADQERPRAASSHGHQRRPRSSGGRPAPRRGRLGHAGAAAHRGASAVASAGGTGGGANAAVAGAGTAATRSRAASSAAMNSSASAKRAPGPLRARAARPPRARADRRVERARRAGGSETCLSAIATALSPSNGTRAGEQLVEDHADRVEVRRRARPRGPAPARARGTAPCP